MSAEAALGSHTWPVGDTYTATLTVPRPRPGALLSAVIEWSPSIPTRLSPAEMEQYRAGRAAAIQRLGLNALVIDI